jgi:hypothetical protein
MFKRSKIFLGFALLGFFAGVGGYILYKEALPVVLRVFPFLLTVEWLLSGLIGTVFTLVVLIIWASVSTSK